MKKNIFNLLFILALFAGTFMQSTLKKSSSNEIVLTSLIKQAEACAEVGGMGHECCPSDRGWCFIGGGYEIYPFYAQ